MFFNCRKVISSADDDAIVYARHFIEQVTHSKAPHAVKWLTQSGQGWAAQRGDVEVAKADDRHIVGRMQSQFVRDLQNRRGDGIAETEDGGGTRVGRAFQEGVRRCHVGFVLRKVAAHQVVFVENQSGFEHGDAKSGFAQGSQYRDGVAGYERDAGVAQPGQVAHSGPHAAGIIGGDLGDTGQGKGGVEKHQRRIAVLGFFVEALDQIEGQVEGSDAHKSKFGTAPDGCQAIGTVKVGENFESETVQLGFLQSAGEHPPDVFVAEVAADKAEHLRVSGSHGPRQLVLAVAQLVSRLKHLLPRFIGNANRRVAPVENERHGGLRDTRAAGNITHAQHWIWLICFC